MYVFHIFLIQWVLSLLKRFRHLTVQSRSKLSMSVKNMFGRFGTELRRNGDGKVSQMKESI